MYLKGKIEQRPIIKWCYVENDFIYESAELYTRLSNLYRDGFYENADFFAPHFYKWAIDNGIINQEFVLIDSEKCLEILKEMRDMTK